MLRHSMGTEQPRIPHAPPSYRSGTRTVTAVVLSTRGLRSWPGFGDLLRKLEEVFG